MFRAENTNGNSHEANLLEPIYNLNWFQNNHSDVWRTEKKAMTPHVQRLLSEFDADLPLSKAWTIPSSWYHDPQWARAEQTAVFARSWQIVARAEQMARPGSYVTVDIGDHPILLTRDQSSNLHAFANVCRHRGARVATGESGTTDRLRCRYHGWTYDLAGALRGVPEFDGVENFCRDDYCLPAYRTAEWGPWVMVHQGANLMSDQELTSSYNALFNSLATRWPTSMAEQFQFVARREYQVECNWKVYVDNYLDGGYHVNTIHPALAGVLDYSQYHTIIDELTAVQVSPMRSPREGDDPSAAATRTGDNAYYWWLYPNFMINIYESAMDTNYVLPLSPKRCRVIFDFYFTDTSPDAMQRIAESLVVSDRIQAEDMDICADVQRGLQSDSFRAGRFSVRRESAGYFFHQCLARAMRQHLHGL